MKENNNKIPKCQDLRYKLAVKDYESAKLYMKLGEYKSALITSMMQSISTTETVELVSNFEECLVKIKKNEVDFLVSLIDKDDRKDYMILI